MPPLTEEEIEKRVADSYEIPNNVLNAVPKPVVTIRTSTYQHAPFIRECIEGVLMQKTDFPFEYIIGEDFSTDGTREIVLEYAANYPDIIRVVTADYNVGAKANGQRCANRQRGKYLSPCEGDDSWKDPLKLKKQVEFLEKNNDYGLVHADVDLINIKNNSVTEKANKTLSNKNEPTSKKELFYRLMDADYKIRTATVLYRRDLLEQVPPNDRMFLMGDTPKWLDLSQITKFKYIDEVFAVYRVHEGGASNSSNPLKKAAFRMSMAEMRLYYCEKYGYEPNKRLKNRYNKAVLNYLLHDQSKSNEYELMNPRLLQRINYWILTHKPTRFIFTTIFQLRKIIFTTARKFL